MPVLKVQFNHPGAQKSYRPNNGYTEVDGKIIRDWNNEDSHYRKFLLNKGMYIDDIKDNKPKGSDLFFWGEWEGHSLFKPIQNADYRRMPNGVHQPFHSMVRQEGQNTDPYVFGEDFKYGVCKQTGEMCNLEQDSLILFGSVYPTLERFYIDTVFVVKTHTTATQVYDNEGEGFSETYKRQTLNQLSEYLAVRHVATQNKLYRSQTWWDNKEYFSFVPCKPSKGDVGFERLFIPLNDPIITLSPYPSGRKYLDDSLNPMELWQRIAKIAEKQGFKLGIRIDEPENSNILNGLEVDNNNPSTRGC